MCLQPSKFTKLLGENSYFTKPQKQKTYNPSRSEQKGNGFTELWTDT